MSVSISISRSMTDAMARGPMRAIARGPSGIFTASKPASLTARAFFKMRLRFQPWGGVISHDAMNSPPAIAAAKAERSSIGMAGFGAVYLALLAVWVFVLDLKIKHGPDAPAPHAEGPSDDLLGTLGQRALHEARLTGGGESEPA